MTDKNRKWYAEPEREDGQWEQTANTNRDASQESVNDELVDTSGDSSEIEDVQEDGTVAVGSGLGIDE